MGVPENVDEDELLKDDDVDPIADLTKSPVQEEATKEDDANNDAQMVEIEQEAPEKAKEDEKEVEKSSSPKKKFELITAPKDDEKTTPKSVTPQKVKTATKKASLMPNRGSMAKRQLVSEEKEKAVPNKEDDFVIINEIERSSTERCSTPGGDISMSEDIMTDDPDALDIHCE